MVTRVDAVGSLGKVRKTPQGGIDAPANLTRVGVFVYHLPNGSTQRELRPADEVFKEDSLETLRGAPLTVDHKGMVRTDNWRELTVGHVGDDVKPSGNFVASRVRVQDSNTVSKVESKELVEVSCGYTCDLDFSPGTYNGQKYDAIQRNIKYNHVALGGKNWGRAGNEVAIRIDGAAYTIYDGYTSDMSEARIKELEAELAASKQRADSLESAADKVRKGFESEIDRLKGENTAYKTRIDSYEAQDQANTLDKAVVERSDLLDKARVVLGADAKFDGKPNADIKVEVIKKLQPSINLDGKSADWVSGTFDGLMAGVKRGEEGTSRAAGSLPRLDSANDEKDAIAEARKRNEQRSKDAWKGGK